jgi:hypothetical protein
MIRFKLNHLCFAWAAVVAIGVFTLARHDLTPGVEAPPVVKSYVLQATKIGEGKKTIIMFVHPQCPCSVASLEELRQLMTEHGSQLNATVVMFRSSGAADDWTRSAAWATAQLIPGVEVRADLDGTQAQQCGAQTSGQVFLYDESGVLQFEGGITGSRGHIGDNNSLDTLVSCVSRKQPPQSAPARTPVFGCPIYSETARHLDRN